MTEAKAADIVPAPLTAPAQRAPIDTDRYDRSPALTWLELGAIRTLGFDVRRGDCGPTP
jgi:hypothetical protein